MEIADRPSTVAPRVIVEVPPTLPDVQAQIITMLALKKGTKTFTKATAPQLHFQGYGFSTCPTASRAATRRATPTDRRTS